MEAISNAINRVRDGYLSAVEWVVGVGKWIAAHPHKAGWYGVGAGAALVVILWIVL